MDYAERLRIAGETLGGNIRIVGHAERKLAKKAVRRKSVSGLVYRRHREMDKSQYYSCASKHAYRSQSDASKHANRCMQIRGKRLRVYFCEICQHWHLTSKRRSGGAIRRIRRRTVRYH